MIGDMKDFFISLEYMLHKYNHILKDNTPSKERCGKQIKMMMEAYVISKKPNDYGRKEIENSCNI